MPERTSPPTSPWGNVQVPGREPSFARLLALMVAVSLLTFALLVLMFELIVR